MAVPCNNVLHRYTAPRMGKHTIIYTNCYTFQFHHKQSNDIYSLKGSYTVQKKITNIEMRGTIILLALFLPLGIRAPFIDDNLEYLYPIYKLIEDTVRSDQTLIFKINQAFSPAVNLRYWQVDGAEVVPIEVCLMLHEQPSVLMPCNIIGVRHSHKVKRNCTACWNLRWTNSLLLNLIPGDILLAMEPVITAFLYSDIVQSSHHRRLHLDLHLNDSILPQQKYSMDDYEQAFALFITQVS